MVRGMRDHMLRSDKLISYLTPTTVLSTIHQKMIHDQCIAGPTRRNHSAIGAVRDFVH